MAKFSLRHPLRSLGKLLKEFARRPEPPKPPPPPPPKPPPGPGPGIPSSTLDLDERRADIWNDVTQDNASYPDRLGEVPDWWDLFLDTGAYQRRSGSIHSYDTINSYWEDFLRAFWLNTQEDGHVTRDEFYQETDSDPALVDWERWRELAKTP